MTGQSLVSWKRAPMIRLILPFTWGIIVQPHWPMLREAWLAIVALAMALLFIIRLLPAWKAFRFRAARGLMVYAILMTSGALLSYYAQEGRKKALAHLDRNLPCMLTVEEPLVRKANSYSTLASVQMLQDGVLRTIPGRCLVYFQSSIKAGDITAGQRIFTNLPLQAIPAPMNPGEIDFSEIYARKGIYSQVYIPEKKMVMLARKDSAWIREAILDHRQFILRTLRRYIPDSSSAGLAEAILVGYRVNLPQDLAAAYARTGVMHVIAISGLHISLIFSIMLAVFRLIPQYGKNPWLPLLLAIPVIWWFSMLTGASASVIRSAVMSTLPVCAAVLHRKTNPLNTLSASAMVLLAFQPGWLWDTGFQLSYAAVLGILLYQRKIQRAIFFQHPLARAIWSLLSVTMAAQVFTTPLVFYYFRQFPVLFLFSNLAAVPLSSLILLSELMICACASWPELAGMAGQLATGLILFLNAFISRMDQIPFSVIRHIYIDIPALCLLYGIIGGIHGILYGHRRALLPIVCTLSLLLCTWQVRQSSQANAQQGLLVLQINGQTALMQLEGRNARQYLLPSSAGSPAHTLRALEMARQHFHVVRHDTRLISPTGTRLLRAAHRRILVISGHSPVPVRRLDQAPDMVVMTGNNRITLAQWYQATGCRLFVADGSNSLWKIQQWEKEAEKLPLRLHSTPQQGAFLLD